MRSRIIHLAVLHALIAFLAGSLFAQIDADKELAVNAYRTGDYAKAAKLFKKVVSKNSGDADAWALLGNSYFKQNRFNDSIEPYEKAINLVPTNEIIRLNLATAHMIRRDPRAEVLAASILETNPKSSEANYILGSMAYIRDNYEKAVEYASAATKLDPASADAYRLLYVSLISDFAESPPTKNASPDTGKSKLKKAVEAFEQYYSLVQPNLKKQLEAELKDLRFFAEYYSDPASRKPLGPSAEPENEKDSTPLKIIKKLPPVYPDEARARGAQGIVILMVSFQADGRVGAVMVLKSADKDLDQRSIETARTIRFEPATKKGVPVSVVRRVEYSFAIY